MEMKNWKFNVFENIFQPPSKLTVKCLTKSVMISRGQYSEKRPQLIYINIKNYKDNEAY